MSATYAPLWCKSNFSFLEGASHPEELVEETQRIGMQALALTDRDGVFGMVRGFVKARELGVKLIGGAELTVTSADLTASPLTLDHHAGHGPGWGVETDDLPPEVPITGRHKRPKKGPARRPVLGQPDRLDRVILLAQDRAGWANLVRLITAGRRRCDKGASLVSYAEIAERAGGLIALWELDAPDPVVAALHDAFGDRLYAPISRHHRVEDPAREAAIRARATRANVLTVAANEVLYHARSRRPLQDVLACIRHGVTLSTAGEKIRSNDEHDLRPPHAFTKLFADDPWSVARTLDVAARCTFSLGELRYRYPSERLPSGKTSGEHLRELTFAGAQWRYHNDVPSSVTRQLDAELSVIDDLDYPGYFLTMYEIVSYCRRRDIMCQGRGSAANSAVCFCLGITAVDPIRMGLLFERFLSRERAEPPDIDLDIEHERREEVIQHVYGVYGRDHAAMVCNVIRYRPRSAIRDVGKALGIPDTALDRAAKHLSMYGLVEKDALERAGLVEHGAAFDHLARLADEILEFPRHLGVHPGGFLLGHEPVHDIVPIENAAMPGRTVIQWDKDDLEDLGLFKVDLLGLGALHQLHLGLDLMRKHRGIELSMATIPAEDAPTYDMICTADTVGTFQIESRAQMSMLPRLQPRTFYDLVVEVSLVRPGPISGGMVHPYLRRRRGLEKVEYPHPCLEQVLAKTLGVPLFQEQVMRLAVVAADYTPGEADQLRRDMAAWRRTGRIEKHRDRLISAMAQKGIAREFGERVFEQIRGFGEYGFPESHAASFALIAYATCWMRRHYLPEFTCSLLNAQPMGFYSPSTIINDAQRHGLEVRPIDVLASNWDCTMEPCDDDFGFAVRMGLRWIRGIQDGEGARIIEARAAREFDSVEDFVRRVAISARIHDALAQAGAFQSLAGVTDGHPPEIEGRRDALWQVAGWIARKQDQVQLDEAYPEPTLPDLGHLEEIFWDYRTSDHSTRGHPLAPLRVELAQRGWPDARTISKGRDGARTSYVGIVICRQQPGTASGVVFMTMEDESGFVNVVCWQQVFAKYAHVIRTTSLLGISGRLQVSEGIVHLIADSVFAPELSRQVVDVASRDFH